ncbi:MULTISPECIES: aliphatic sulfonate ABC transporter substrate-binding protein [Paenibacillus]|uniref:aliphatic sulfonate ABC transporter substrate-binding protein n=1 Tax=Paenibacillus TaxID=44249 RepID=UPI0004F63473|nr:aliphatic sulfonate ABC transporter substrate-binding protein [Paenibacillus odorifer]AIQ75624.1 sulfonate ABC transporter substrate-binding protein [Paenibacillus odorifer]OMC97202.1 sulfonate ABC transporter substrate-binding protein [Paenibacillus odorifer]OMD09398.1 sulfonate ABC transporter substrate-binding protein [Paenibacillus odorifer]OMD17757.1 sulfonate ABC transporter substrate-binding protein [Paenibacillus odorifer]OMD30481.1 sulfonate ABC transporter substrate-binding protei
MKLFRNSLLVMLVLSVFATGCASNEKSAGKNDANKYEGVTIKIGVQGSGGMFGKAREEKWYEQEFDKLGVKVEWTEFQSGPPMTEAIASNKLDIATLGNMPVIAAQAAGIPIKIISQVLEGTNNVALLVPSSSTAQKLEDLKGKKIAVTKGSNAYNFLYRGIEESGLKEADFEIIQLQPDEAQPAFETGGVDAWATWDPYITLNALTGKGKVLTDGEQLGVLSPSFVISRSAFAEKYPELVTLYLKVTNKAIAWETDNRAEATERYAAERNIPAAVIEGTFERSQMINIPISDAVVEELQKTANFQFNIKNIRKEIEVSKITDNQYIEAALKEPLK